MLEIYQTETFFEKKKIKLEIQSKEYIIREKAKRREKKVRELTVRERRRQKIMFPTTTEEYNIYRRCNEWKRDCFPKFFFGKQPIENKLYIY